MLFSSCEKQPTACLNLDETLEAGTFLNLSSCSKDYEFLTWEFSDGIGTEGEVAQRTFEKEGEVTIRVTAYSDGAYKSDFAEQTCKLSYRYIDRLEISGNFSYDSIIVILGNIDGYWTFRETDTTYSEDAPLIKQWYPTYLSQLESKTSSLTLTGYRGSSSEIKVASKKFDFRTYKENPIIVESDNGQVKMSMYWTFKE